jgi:streptogramin lyase
MLRTRVKSCLLALSAITLLSGVLLTERSVFALDPKRKISHHRHNVWGTEQGLPQSTVLAIAQTRDGYLWVGTEKGLARFDGIRFTVYNKDNTPALEHERINALLEDNEGSLWIATYGGGLGCLRDGKFKFYKTSEGLPSNTVMSLALDQSGTVWIGTMKGLARFSEGRFTVFTIKDGLSSDDARKMCVGPDGSIWTASINGGLNRLKQGKVRVYT